ncbi:MAG: pre-peptidase C-terminal domain-containing protein, partial [Anaerolineae bacterium]|nr:pre-peptidase C-terminal domain-containing protein [Anaerolineae bacterium]
QRVQPYAITRITDNDGNEIPLPARPEPQQVIQPEHAYLVTSILSDDEARATEFGRGSVLNIPGYNVAVKTGTTNDNRDNWTIGYAPNVVVGVWHGNTDNSPMAGTSGFIAAAPIWNAVMHAVLDGTSPEIFPAPPGIITRQICADSGTLPSIYCTNQRTELFAQAQPPPGPENDIYQMVTVNTLNNLRANEFCANFVGEEMFLNISDNTAFAWLNNTSAGQAWLRNRGLTAPALPVPTQSCTASTSSPIVMVDVPLAGTQVQGLVEVRGRVFVFDFANYQIEYGIGEAPAQFTVVDGPYNLQHQNSELLGRWDVTALPNGPYTLRLHVETNGGGFADLDQVVYVNNPVITPTFTPSPTLTQPPIIYTLTPTPTVTQPPMIYTLTPTFTLPPTITPGAVMTELPPHDPNVFIPVVYGAQASDIISDGQVAVYYGFEGAAGDNVQISAENTAGTLDTLLYLMDAAGNILMMDDDGGTGTDSLLTYTLPLTGRYLIVVTRFDVSNGFSSGEYRMTLLKTN